MRMQIRPIGPAGLDQALDIVRAVFMDFVAPDYSPAGVQEFLDYIDPARMREKTASGKIRLWGCYAGSDPVGVLGLKTPCHICLLFVDKGRQRQGIARALLSRALACCPGAAVTVNSSPYALNIYEKLGFVADSPEQTVNGIRFTPMTRPPQPQSERSGEALPSRRVILRRESGCPRSKTRSPRKWSDR